MESCSPGITLFVLQQPPQSGLCPGNMAPGMPRFYPVVVNCAVGVGSRAVLGVVAWSLNCKSRIRVENNSANKLEDKPSKRVASKTNYKTSRPKLLSCNNPWNRHADENKDNHNQKWPEATHSNAQLCLAVGTSEMKWSRSLQTGPQRNLTFASWTNALCFHRVPLSPIAGISHLTVLQRYSKYSWSQYINCPSVSDSGYSGTSFFTR